MKRQVYCKTSKRVKVSITLEEDVFLESGYFISNLSGFLNKTLKDYINYKKKELENEEKTTAELDSHKNLLCEIDKIKREENSLYEEIKKIASVKWTNTSD